MRKHAVTCLTLLYFILLYLVNFVALSKDTCLTKMITIRLDWDVVGHVLVQISWTCPQSNPSIQVNGFKLLVDGKQYGETLRASVKTIRIKVSQLFLMHF